MNHPVHMLFAPTGTLKHRTPAYHAVHADLRFTAAKAKRASLSKHERGVRRVKIYKQTGELHV